MKPLILTFALALCLPAFGKNAADNKESDPQEKKVDGKNKERFGESLKECSDRFGEGMKDPERDNITVFHKNGIRIEVRFREDEAVAFTFKKLKISGIFSVDYIDLDKSQIDELLKVYSNGKKWMNMPKGQMKAIWLRSDQKVVARHRDNLFEVISMKEIETAQKEDKKKVESSVEGF